MFYSKEKIESEISALLHGEPRTWAQIGMLINSVSEQKLYTSNNSKSISEWVEDLGKKIDRKKATLWRYMSAGVKYNNLLKRVVEYDADLTSYFPPLESLSSSVSAESIEILEKISRVIEITEVAELLDCVIKGSVSRDALREKWQAYRPALSGRTARGRPFETIRVDNENKSEQLKVIEGKIFAALKQNDSKWLGHENPSFFRILLNVYPDNKNPAFDIYKDLAVSSHFDAVAMIKEKPGAPLIIHGIEIAALITPNVIERVAAMKWYCNVMWLAVLHNDPVDQKISLDIPEGIGVLAVTDSGDVKMLKNASEGFASPLLDCTLRGIVLKSYGYDA